MSGRTVTPPYHVTNAYESFLEEFRKAVEGRNGQVLPLFVPLGSCFRESSDSGSVDFTICLYLKGCPCKRLPHGKRLDVVIKALETLDKSSWSLMRSSVYLNYFVAVDSMCQLVQSLHYDFVDGGQANHPFFHVQLTDESMPEGDLRSVGFELQLDVSEEPSQCWVDTRIPTPDMTLASVLYCLVADHLAEIFSQFAESVDAVQDRLPTLRFEALTKSLQKSSLHFKSSHWFAHMRLPTEQES